MKSSLKKSFLKMKLREGMQKSASAQRYLRKIAQVRRGWAHVLEQALARTAGKVAPMTTESFNTVWKPALSEVTTGLNNRVVTRNVPTGLAVPFGTEGSRLHYVTDRSFTGSFEPRTALTTDMVLKSERPATELFNRNMINRAFIGDLTGSNVVGMQPEQYKAFYNRLPQPVKDKAKNFMNEWSAQYMDRLNRANYGR